MCTQAISQVSGNTIFLAGNDIAFDNGNTHPEGLKAAVKDESSDSFGKPCAQQNYILDSNVDVSQTLG